MESLPQFMTIREVASTGLISEHHLRMMEKKGTQPGIRTGKTYRVNFGLLVEQLTRESLMNGKDA